MKKAISVVFSVILFPIITSLLAGYLSEPFRLWCKDTLVIKKCYYIVFGIVLAVTAVLSYFFCKGKLEHRSDVDKKQSSYFEGLERKFKEIVDDIDYLQSMQLYKYRLSTHGKEENIIINYVCGYSDISISINAIQQDYYSIPRELFRRYNEAAQKYNTWLTQQGAQAQSTAHQYKEIANKISNDLEFSLLEEQRIDEDKCSLYRLFRAQKSNLTESKLIDFVFDESYHDYERGLLSFKRTGLLPSIFFEDTRFFRNVSNSGKNGRIYMTCRWHSKKGKRGILLFALDGNVVSSSKGIQEVENDIERALNTWL